MQKCEPILCLQIIQVQRICTFGQKRSNWMWIYSINTIHFTTQQKVYWFSFKLWELCRFNALPKACIFIFIKIDALIHSESDNLFDFRCKIATNNVSLAFTSIPLGLFHLWRFNHSRCIHTSGSNPKFYRILKTLVKFFAELL